MTKTYKQMDKSELMDEITELAHDHLKYSLSAMCERSVALGKELGERMLKHESAVNPLSSELKLADERFLEQRETIRTLEQRSKDDSTAIVHLNQMMYDDKVALGHMNEMIEERDETIENLNGRINHMIHTTRCALDQLSELNDGL